ncbi:MAG: universal stress protein [Pseudomonadales bacterium]|nr:universal stress protein [Pseudomonadales bacterium]
MRSIAIPVADREECAIALDVAFRLGKTFGSDVVGYHMRPNKMAASNTRLDVTELWSGGAAWPEEDEKTSEKAALSAHKLFQLMAEQHQYPLTAKHSQPPGRHAIWREKLGSPDKLMPLVGPVNDLMVVSRPRRNGGRKAWLILMSALLDSGIPVLVLPQKKVELSCKHIAIAWNRGPQEVQAVHATLGLLKQAGQLTFITSGKNYKHGPSAKEMIAYLKCHGIKAAELRTDGNPVKDLVKTAQKIGADTLLSGAYTKGRLRQMLFGGVTEHLIWDTAFPVLLKHS